MLNQLIGVAQRNVTLDTEITTKDLLDLGIQFKDFDPDELVSYTPGRRREDGGGESVLILDKRATEPMFEVFRGNAPIPGRPGERDQPAPLLDLDHGRQRVLHHGDDDTRGDHHHAPEFIPRTPDGESCG